MKFAENIIAWQERHGRHDLPWQASYDPYKIWLSEIMLQQTQVMTVIPYYQRFLDRFPNVMSLAHATEDEVLSYWAGLGYYTRARNLHRCAQLVCERFDALFPHSADILVSLPGIGRSTAAAIAAFSVGERAAILDGNVKRVLARHFGVEGDLSRRANELTMWQLAEQLLPDSIDGQLHQKMRAYTQGLMDMGATLCTRTKPLCNTCPVALTCIAKEQGLQLLLPTPKIKKSLATKHAVFLLWQQGEAVLLVQRPSPGIWGGLWCLPEYESEEQLYAEHPNCDLGAAVYTEIKHTFSHYHLVMRIYHVNQSPSTVSEVGHTASGVWFDKEKRAKLGFPKPIHRLLTQLDA